MFASLFIGWQKVKQLYDGNRFNLQQYPSGLFGQMTNMKMNALSFDLEDWFCAYNLRIRMEDWDKQELRVVENTERILEMLNKHNPKAESSLFYPSPLFSSK